MEKITVEEYKQLLSGATKKGKRGQKKGKDNIVLRKESDNVEISFTINLSPVTKKNHQRIVVPKGSSKPIVIPSQQYTDYQKNAQWFIPKNHFINSPVNIKCLFYMPTHRKCDLTNLLESIDDVMVYAGLLADDNYEIIAAHDGSRVLYDKENPRTEVYITKFIEGESNG